MREGRLKFNYGSGRWRIEYECGGYDELTSGSVCECLVGIRWERTRIEHALGAYYAVNHLVMLMAGTAARLPA